MKYFNAKHTVFFVVTKDVIFRWSKSNSEFKEPVVYGQNAMQERLNRNTFSEIARGKARKSRREEWEPKLDTLLDISFCRCPIVFCGDRHAPCKDVCNDQAHCLCSCALKYRLPKKELFWFKAQRAKTGKISDRQEFGNDAKETAKLKKNACVSLLIKPDEKNSIGKL